MIKCFEQTIIPELSEKNVDQYADNYQNKSLTQLLYDKHFCLYERQMIRIEYYLLVPFISLLSTGTYFPVTRDSISSRIERDEMCLISL